MPKIFVNFRTSDVPLAAILIDESMVARFGAENVFRDRRSIPIGVEFTGVLWDRLAECDVILVVIGPRWLTVERDGVRRLDEPDDYVRREIATALANRIVVVPVLVGDAAMPRSDDLPEAIRPLANHQYIRLRELEAHRDLGVLADELAARGAGAVPTTGAAASVRDGSGTGAEAGPGPAPVVAIRIDGYQALPEPVQINRRTALFELFRTAAAAATISWATVAITDRTDGAVLGLPGQVSVATVAGRLVPALAHQLGDHAGLRLCLSVHYGQGSPALDRAHRLVDNAVLDAILAAATNATLVVIASAESHHQLAIAADRHIDLAKWARLAGADDAWVHVPGYPAPPGLPRRPEQPAGAVGHVSVQTVSGGIVVGAAHTVVAGDLVGRDKNVYGGRDSS
jgi:hypothetical protein